MDHNTYIQQEILQPVVGRLKYFLNFNKIDFAGRIAVDLEDWDVMFHGLFHQSKTEGLAPVQMVQYDSVRIRVSVKIDGIEVSDKMNFEFSNSLKDYAAFVEAIEGSGFQIYRVAEPVLTNGFCSHCDKPYRRNESDNLSCDCIDKAMQGAK